MLKSKYHFIILILLTEAQKGEVTCLSLLALSPMNLSFFRLCSHIIVCMFALHYYYSPPYI